MRSPPAGRCASSTARARSWVLSTVALEQVGALEAAEAGIERDQQRRPTGRLFRLDGWLRGRLPGQAPPDLAEVGRRLASYGVTGVTDCTPAGGDRLLRAHRRRRPLRRPAGDGLGHRGPELSEATPPPPLHRGPVKILITDHAFPSLDEVS